MKNKIKILILSGDGIGPEVMAQALRVFNLLKGKSNFEFEITEELIGGAAFVEFKEHFPSKTQEACRQADIILFGAVGGPVSEQLNPVWKNCEVNSILALRKLLDLFANIRPVKVDHALVGQSPLRLERFAPIVPDLVVVRELSGDVYFGQKGRRENGNVAFDEGTYSVDQVERITEFAFDLARARKFMVHSIDKANVLETSRLWRETANRLADRNKDVRFETMLVDNCAMQLINDPTIFDVVLTSNMFGDILSDAAAVIPGSLGLLASASYGSSGKWLFEPPSGSAPDIAGKNVANPIGMIRCIGMMFEMALKEKFISEKIENAISETLFSGVRTADLIDDSVDAISCSKMTDLILDRLEK